MKHKVAESTFAKRLLFLKHKLFQPLSATQEEPKDKDFIQNSQNLALTDDSLRILHRFKDFSKK